MTDEPVLSGIKVVDLSQGVAGPSAGSLLARYGAEVTKVEPLGGDWLRTRGYAAGPLGGHAAAVNVGKRSIALDIKTPAAKEVLRAMLARADICIESFRPGVMGRLGFAYEDVRGFNDAIIYASVSGFGQDGPWREKGGIDVVMQAFTGLMNRNRGAIDGQPHRIGFWIVDVATGLYALQAILAALFQRQRTGRGRHLDCSLLRSAVALQAMPIMEHSSGKDEGTTLTASPLGTFRTRDGWINLAVQKDSQWPPFCLAIGRPDLASDPSLATARQRCARNAEIVALVSDALAGDTSGAWQDRLERAGVLCERVNDYADLLAHPQVEAAAAISWIDHRGLGRVAVANPPGIEPLRGSGPGAQAPIIGQHGPELLGELGYSRADIDRMITEGVVGTAAAEQM